MEVHIMEKEKDPKEKHEGNFVEVAIVTTSGSYPATGYLTIPIHQKVRVDLEKASKELNIVDTSNWVASVGGNEINIELSYLENHLDGKVDINWGPRAGGGGSI